MSRLHRYVGGAVTADHPGWTGRLPYPGEDVADFADLLIREWGTVPPAQRDVWLRRRLSDFVERPKHGWRRRVGL